MIRRAINIALRPFGICIGRIIRVQKMVAGKLVEQPLLTGWRAYRVLPLKSA